MFSLLFYRDSFLLCNVGDDRASQGCGELEMWPSGTSLAVQWLRLYLPVLRVQVQTLGCFPSWEAKIPHPSWPKKSKHETEAIL